MVKKVSPKIHIRTLVRKIRREVVVSRLIDQICEQSRVKERVIEVNVLGVAWHAHSNHQLVIEKVGIMYFTPHTTQGEGVMKKVRFERLEANEYSEDFRRQIRKVWSEQEQVKLGNVDGSRKVFKKALLTRTENVCVVNSRKNRLIFRLPKGESFIGFCCRTKMATLKNLFILFYLHLFLSIQLLQRATHRLKCMLYLAMFVTCVNFYL